MVLDYNRCPTCHGTVTNPGSVQLRQVNGVMCQKPVAYDHHPDELDKVSCPSGLHREGA